MIKLSSLRVSAEMDVSGYVRGMAQKVSADKAGADSARAVGASFAQIDAALSKTERDLDKAYAATVKLSRAHVEGYRASSDFEKQIRAVGHALDTGMRTDRAVATVEALYRKFGLVADAAGLAKQGFVSLAPIIGEINARFEVQTEVANRAARALNAAAGASSFQASLNSQFGIGQAAPSAEESAGTFKAMLEQQERRSQAFVRELNERLGVGLGTLSARDAASAFQGGLTAAEKRIEAEAKQAIEASRAAAAEFHRSLNERMGVGVGTLSARDSSTAFSGMFAEEDRRAAEQAAAAQVAAAERLASVRIRINESLGIGRPALPARDSARAFEGMLADEDARELEEASRAAEDYARRAEALRASLDPVFAAQQQANREIAEAIQLLDVGKISWDEYTAAMLRANRGVRQAEIVRDMQPAFAVHDQAVQDNRARDQDARQMEDYRRRAAALEASLDPMAEAQQRFNAAVAEAGTLLHAGAINVAAYQKAVTEANREWMKAQAVADMQPAFAAYGDQAVADNRAHDQRMKEIQELKQQARQVRADVNPVGYGYDLLTEKLAHYRKMLAASALTQDEFNDAVARAQHAFKVTQQSYGAQGNTNALNRHQALNLGFQVNDVITMLASGSNPIQVIMTQGGQLIQIAQQAEGGWSAMFKSIIGWFTPVRVGFLGIGAAIATVAYGFVRFSDAQMQMERAISGIGQGAGVTAKQLDEMAQATARAANTSNQRARDTLSALVGTGRIQGPMAGQIAARERDFAATTGLSTAEANRLLAESFADPIRGAENLNRVLGGLTAEQERYIGSLQRSGRLHEAQQALFDTFVGRIRPAVQLTTEWQHGWEMITAGINNSIEAMGRWLRVNARPGDNLRGLAGLEAGRAQADVTRLTEQIRGFQTQLSRDDLHPRIVERLNTQLREARTNLEEAERRLTRFGGELTRINNITQRPQGPSQTVVDEQAAFDQQASRSRRAVQTAGGINDERIAQFRADLEAIRDLTTTIDREQQRIAQGQRRTLDPGELERTIRARDALRRGIEDNVTSTERLFDANGRLIATDEQALRVHRDRLGVAQQTAVVERLRNQAATATEGQEDLQRRLIIEERRLEAARERAAAGTREEVTARAVLDVETNRLRNVDQLNAAMRERVRTMRDNIATTLNDNQAIGQGVYETERLREANRLVTEARREYTRLYGPNAQVPEAEIQSYQRLADKIARARAEASRLKIESDIRFDRLIMGLSDAEARIAQTLRPHYGDNVAAALNSGHAAALRFNNALRETRDISSEAFSSFVRDLASGKSAMEALTSALQRLADRLLDMASRNAVNQIFGGLTGAGGGKGGQGGGFLSGIMSFFGMSGGKMHSGGIVGLSGEPMLIPMAAMANAPRYHTGLMSDEFAAVLQRGEQVLTAQRARQVGGVVGGMVAANGNGAIANDRGAPDITINNYGGGEVRTKRKSNGGMQIDIGSLLASETENPNSPMMRNIATHLGGNRHRGLT